MNSHYNKLKIVSNAYRLQDKIYAKLTEAASKAAASPAETTADRFVKLVKVSGLNSARRYQFFRPYQSTVTAAITADAIARAVYTSRKVSLLPLGSPFLLGSMALYALVGTGEKVDWVTPDSHPLVMAAAVVTRHGLLGLPEIAAYRTGRALKKAGLGSLARAAYAAATCFSYMVEPLRAALACASFLIQIPYSIIGGLIDLGLAGLCAAYHGSLSAEKCVWDARDIFAKTNSLRPQTSASSLRDGGLSLKAQPDARASTELAKS